MGEGVFSRSLERAGSGSGRRLFHGIGAPSIRRRDQGVESGCITFGLFLFLALAMEWKILKFHDITQVTNSQGKTQMTFSLFTYDRQSRWAQGKNRSISDSARTHSRGPKRNTLRKNRGVSSDPPQHDDRRVRSAARASRGRRCALASRTHRARRRGGSPRRRRRRRRRRRFLQGRRRAAPISRHPHHRAVGFSPRGAPRGRTVGGDRGG